MAVKVVTKSGAKVWVCWVLYQEFVQTVMLYGIKIWVVTASMFKVLEGFHHQVARRIAGKMA